MDISEYKAEELQDIIDILDAILGNEEGVSYVVKQAFKEMPGGKEGEEQVCVRKEAFYFIANVLEVWKEMLNLKITENFVRFALGPGIEYTGAGYTATEMTGFILKIFVALRTMLQERTLSLKEGVPAKT